MYRNIQLYDSCPADRYIGVRNLTAGSIIYLIGVSHHNQECFNYMTQPALCCDQNRQSLWETQDHSQIAEKPSSYMVGEEDLTVLPGVPTCRIS